MANIRKLVPLSKSKAQKMGIVQVGGKLMFDSSRLTEKKKYQSKEVVPARKPKPKLAERQVKEDESKGLY
jgi:hypothetical protein